MTRSRGAGMVLIGSALAGLVWLIVRGTRDSPAVVGSIVTASVAIVVAALGRYWADAREAAMQHRQEVAPIYEEFVERYFALMPKPWLGEKPTRIDPNSPSTDRERDLAEFYDRMTRRLLVWGSPSVVTAWSTFQETVRQIPVGTEDPAPGLVAFEDLLLALRRDLGHRDGAIDRGGLLRTYLRDIDGPALRTRYPRR